MSQQPILGLYTDTRPVSQPPGTYRYALNAVTETNKGDTRARSAEVQNSECYDLREGHFIIGSINLDGNDKVIFTTNPNNGSSEISLITNQCTRTSLILDDCLNFSITAQVSGEYRLREGCKRTIYFRDTENPPRIINIDSLSNYQDDDGNWNCNLMKWFPDYTIPQIDLDHVANTGGQIPVGVVQFTITYMDEDLNPIGYITPTNPIAIISQSEADEDRLKEGGYQEELFGTTGYTNKSVVLTLSNLDTQFKYFRIGALETYSGTGQVTRAILKPPIEINSTSTTYIYTGFNSNSDILTTEDELTQSRIVYDRFKDITQIGNRMIAAGTQSKNIDFSILQRQVANEIQVRYITNYRLARDGNKTSKTPQHYFSELSLPRDEVVALGIVFFFTDGSESPVFHIPGREKDTTSAGVSISSSAIEATDPAQRHRRNASIDGLTSQGWDSATYNPGTTDIYQPEYRHITDLDSDGYIERWRAYNTAYREESQTAVLSNINNQDWVTKGQMGYHECTTKYPSIQDCDDNYIYPRNSDDSDMAYIRHHRIPDSTVEPHMGPQFENNSYVSYIGLEITNVNIPASLSSQIQGWKIVRANYTDSERSIIDRGIIYHNIIAERTPGDAIQYQTGGYSRHRYARQWFPDGDVYIQNCDYYPKINGLNDNDYNGYPGANDFFKANASSGKENFGTPLVDYGYSVSFHGPKSKFESKILEADFIKFDLELVGLVRWFCSHGIDKTGEGAGRATDPPGLEGYPVVSGGDRKGKSWCLYKDYEIPNRAGIDHLGASTAYYNRQIDRQHFVQPDTISPQGMLSITFNNIKQQETYVIESTDDIPVNPKDQEWGQFQDTSKWLLTNDTWVYETDFDDSGLPRSLNGQSIAHYVSLKKYLSDQFSSLASIKYLPLDNILNTSTSSTTWGGETHISVFESRKTDYFANCADDPNVASGYYGYSFLVESTINVGLRNGGNLMSGFDGSTPAYDCEFGQVERYPAKYYFAPNQFSPVTHDSAFHFGNIFDQEDFFGDYLSLNYCHHNFYRYNQDFSKPNNDKIYLPLELNFDWCTSCQYKQPLQYIYSETSFQEETTDRYRVFKPNNYRILPGHTGIINDLFIKNNQLYIHTTQSTWFQPVNPQTIQTNETNLYIGTGEFFSIPPTEPISKPNGYWGCQSKWSVVPTEYGVFWVDAKGGDVFLFSGDGDPNINTGENAFFKNNLKLTLPEQLSNLGVTIASDDNTANINGVGYIATFDSRIDRYILTKKDYRLRDESLFVNAVVLAIQMAGNTAVTGSVTYVPETSNWFVFNGTSLERIYLTDFDYFDNLSWTRSYSPKDKSWTSFHSYLPSFMYSDRNTFYSTNNSSSIYKHEGTGFLNFYGVQYPFIIDYISELSPITKKFSNIEYLSTVEEYNSTTDQYLDKENETFTSLIAYTDTQSTGTITITPKTNPYDSISYTTGTLLADRPGHARTWRINYLRDLVSSRSAPIFTKDQTNTTFQTEFPIDKVPNSSVITQAQDQYNQAYLKDKYLGVRLSFLSTINKKISFDLESTTNLKELR